jgi:hypothetical protein
MNFYMRVSLVALSERKRKKARNLRSTGGLAVNTRRKEKYKNEKTTEKYLRENVLFRLL